MQSSFNVIKNPYINIEGDEVIQTEYASPKTMKIVEGEKPHVEQSIEKLSQIIIKDAKIKAEALLEEAKNRALSIQKEAHDFGYDEGFNKGFAEGMEKSLREGREKKEEIINSAEKLLYSAKEQYAGYFKEKEKELLSIIYEIAYNYLKKEVENESSITSMIKEELTKIKNSHTILIKIHPNYMEELEKNLELWKTTLGLKENVFLLPDESMELGEVIIEKDNGKIVLNLQYAMDKIKNEIFSRG